MSIKELNPFQREFVKWFYPKQRAILRASPGAGKTLAAMATLLLMRKRNEGSTMLVVTKTKAAKAFEKANIKHLSITKIFASKELSLFYEGNPFVSDIYMISAGMINNLLKGSVHQKKALQTLLNKTDLFVIDEIHNYRSYKSTVTKALKYCTDYYQKLLEVRTDKRLLGITATPVFKNLVDWFHLFSIIQPRLFNNYFSFLDRYCIVQERGSYVNRRFHTGNGSSSVKKSITFTEIVGYKNVDELHDLVKPYLFTYDNDEFKYHYTLNYWELSQEEIPGFNDTLQGFGLDKSYTIKIRVGEKETLLYRDKNDTFYDLNDRLIQVKDLSYHSYIRWNREPARVVGIYDKSKDATYAVRLIKMQEYLDSSPTKLQLLYDRIKSREGGALVYFSYLSSVDKAYQFLLSKKINRRVVVLTGQTSNFNAIVASLRPDDIVLATRAAAESFDFYFDHLILYSQVTSPGFCEQLFGRLSRYNQSTRDIYVDFLLRPSSVETYFYSRLCYLLRTVKTNTYAKDLPTIKELQDVDPKMINIQFLKERLLWQKGV